MKETDKAKENKDGQPRKGNESPKSRQAQKVSQAKTGRGGRKKNSYRARRRRMTAALVLIAAALVAGVFIVMAAVERDRTVSLPFLWTNETMAYTSADQAAAEYEDSPGATYAIGGDNVTNDNISLQGNESGALFDLDGRCVLFAKSMHQKIYPASITKLMTAILAFQYGDMDQSVTITWQDLELESGSQVVGFRIGDVVTMDALLHGLLIHSGNDAAQAIARTVGGTQEHFVEMMNEELQNLGCTNSHFTNPTGLHDENHYTSVYDIYLMLNEAMKYDEFMNITQIAVYDLAYRDANGNEQHVTLDATDLYLTGEVEPPKDVTVLGGKTGTTSAAGHCLAVIARNAYGQFYISVIVGASTAETLYEDMNTLLAQING